MCNMNKSSSINKLFEHVVKTNDFKRLDNNIHPHRECISEGWERSRNLFVS